MFSKHVLPFYPRKIASWGGAVLLAATLLAGGAIIFFSPDASEFFLLGRTGEALEKSASFALGLNQKSPGIPLPRISQEFIFSFDCPRPDEVASEPFLFVKIKKTGQSKRVVLPCRLNLEFADGDRLKIVEGGSCFWMELNISSCKKVGGKVFIENHLSETIEAENFICSIQDPPFQGPQEFSEGSPFRCLSEARWWGPDKFREKHENGALYQKIEIGSLPQLQFFDLQEGDWLIWMKDRWVKGALSEGNRLPIARIKAVRDKFLVMEGWDMAQYIHLALNHIHGAAWKMKGEELFSSIRIRSPKQMSCMIEKQWLILKVGDWVLKADGRWKVLKKQEEKELYKTGKLNGELFVFEKIESKSGQKIVQGQLFHPDRSQSLFIELPLPIHGAHKGKHEGDLRKGIGFR
jgi:hypothetical protein